MGYSRWLFMEAQTILSLSNVGKLVCNDIDKARINQLLRLIIPTQKMRETPRAKEFFKFEGLSLDIHKGDKVYICAQPKSGKSLLAKLITGIIEPSKGTVKSHSHVIYFQSKLNLNRPLMTLEQYGWTVASVLKIPVVKTPTLIEEAILACELSDDRQKRIYDINQDKIKNFQNYIQLSCEADIFVFEDILPLKWSDKLFELYKTKTFILISAGWLPPRPFVFKKNFVLTAKGLVTLSDISFAPNLCKYKELFETYITAGTEAYLSELQETLAPKITNPELVNSRKGSGLVRFAGMLMKDTLSGKLSRTCKTGQNVTFALYYEQLKMTESLNDGHCVFLIESSNGTRILGSSMLSLGGPFPKMPSKGCVSLEVDKFPVIPGDYNLVVSISFGATLSDKVVSEWILQVEPGDFYGHPKLPLPKWGETLLDYKWSHVKGEAPNPQHTQCLLKQEDNQEYQGKVYISGIELKNLSQPGSMQAKTGDEVEFKVYYKLAETVSESNQFSAWARITIRSDYKPEAITSLVMQAPFDEVVGLSKEGVFIARVPSLNLFPQKYIAAVHLTVDGEVAAKVMTAFNFEIMASDFLPGGEKPSITWGQVFIKPRWNLRAQKNLQEDEDSQLSADGTPHDDDDAAEDMDHV